MTDLPPSPALIAATLGAYERTGALIAAVELDLFTAIAAGAGTPAALAAACGAAERGVRILADGLVVLGLLEKAEGRYRLTADSAAFLDRNSPTYLGAFVRFAASPQKFERHLLHLAAIVRAGGTAGPANTAPENPVWVDYAQGMGPLSAPLAEGLADHLLRSEVPAALVLDVAAGHGLFGIAVGRRNPGAHIVALDWEPVLEVAKANAAAAGLADRYSTCAGDAFSVDFGSGYDLVLVPNFLHHFDCADCTRFLRRVSAALRPGGCVAILDYVPEADRTAPPQAVWFALTMLANTPRGDAYTGDEFASMCREAGLAHIRVERLPGSPQSIILARRPS